MARGKLCGPALELTKPAHVRFDEHSAREPETFANSRAKALLQFWEHRSGKKLALSSAREMQSNVEGLIGLLAQWARKDCAEAASAVRLREQHDAAKG
jgi:hypothetical protein